MPRPQLLAAMNPRTVRIDLALSAADTSEWLRSITITRRAPAGARVAVLVPEQPVNVIVLTCR